MSDPAYALQAALAPFLKALNTAAGNRVYDTVPRAPITNTITAKFPFIAIGSGDAFPIDEDCGDRTDTTFTVDFWSREPGFPEAKTAGGILRDALHEQTLSITDHVVDRMRVERIEYIRDPDGVTSRSRLTVNIETSALPQ